VTDIGERAGEPSEADPPAPLPPDPAEYDTERNALARARGLAAPYIAGGHDPEPEAGLQEERRLLRLLLIMVGAIVAGGFVLGIIANVMAAMGGS
jgi:hypothetical protein